MFLRFVKREIWYMRAYTLYVNILLFYKLYITVVEKTRKEKSLGTVYTLEIRDEKKNEPKTHRTVCKFIACIRLNFWHFAQPQNNEKKKPFLFSKTKNKKKNHPTQTDKSTTEYL